ncbi:MAG: addiction module protein [Planctomycetes bacterium]|nr:addiction module protein [Planctomycetota bacterium]
MVREALKLSREDRAFLAEKLLASLDFEEPFDLSDEWKQEIARRRREVEAGAVELIPGETVLKEAAARLRR